MPRTLMAEALDCQEFSTQDRLMATEKSPTERLRGKVGFWSWALWILVLAAIPAALLLRARKPSRAGQGAESGQHKALPAVTFTDVTKEAGIQFVHVNGAAGEKLLPETMGGGVAFFDFDNDGAPDLLFVNSTHWPWNTNAAAAAKPTMALYRNDGKGRFMDVTAGSGLDM
ncbi:MAG TPA: VCBS repeat-containing protein, partial [Candidatus Acidoferrum sp.]|nr:VCBS repeat-containing protein [Candidatus Acidoferrum sp.]